mmetsp:Transcript_47678/g.120843  ORF Transcript_47678/g.120843 Transcript_47678/m.120843 type:complete len:222 (-) Transcript_47678:798-1463(-)
MLHLVLVQPARGVVGCSARALGPSALFSLRASQIRNTGEALNVYVVVSEPRLQEALRVRARIAVDLHGSQRVKHDILRLATRHQCPSTEISIGILPGHKGVAVVDTTFPIATRRDPHSVYFPEQVQWGVRCDPSEVKPRDGKKLVWKTSNLLLLTDHVKALLLVVIEADCAPWPVVAQRRVQALVAKPIALNLQVLKVDNASGALGVAVESSPDVFSLPPC